ncbi:ABC transporter ATP-binding protein [Candidatus Woesearchaeota archaeon]|nr:ABC transporter ATP-binding protein [Candidatus Woesearchaeota archaeon]
MIEVKNLSKSFRIQNEKTDTLFDVIKNIRMSKNYTNIWALKNINFNVKRGEFIGIIGENGSGKTTLLKIIAKVLNPTKGYVKTEGRIVPFLELGLGFHDELTGRENVYLYSQIMGLDKKEVNEKIEDIIRFSGIKNFIDAKLNTYSSGMKVRLAFSTAIQTNPDIILVDEVLAVGDMKFQQKCFDIFRKFKEDKKTVLYVSHDMSSIKKFCDRVILLNKGRQIIIDEPEYVTDKYFYSMIRDNEKNRIEFRTEANKPDFRRIEDLKKTVNIRWGTKEIEITKVELFNKFNKKSNMFVSGDPLKIRIHYKKNEEIKNPVFGIGIFYENGKHCFGTNTQVEKYKINKINERGYIDFFIRKIIMWEGNFYLNVMVHDDKHYHYDWHNKTYMFKVVKLNNYDQGLFNLNCKWKISK